MFQLTPQEYSMLRSQIVTTTGKAGRRALPYAFTEHGVSMLSCVLKSQRAVYVSIAIIRAFIQLREMVSGNKELVKRLDDLEQRYDAQFKVVFISIRELISTNPQEGRSLPKRKIGFGREDGSSGKVR